METFFPKCRPSLEETSRTTPTKARNNAKKNNSRDNNNNTTTTSSAVPFSDALLLCAVRLFFSKAAFVLHQRATTPSRSIFSLASTFRRTLNERHKIAQHNASRLLSEERRKRLSLSLCACVPSRTTTGRGGVFVGEKFFRRFKKKLFRRKGKRTMKERNSSRVVCSNENVILRRSPD